MVDLYTLTVAVNYVCMIMAVWLGLFVVTRSPRSPVSWLTALTLFSVSGWFLNVLLAINPPPSPAFLPAWLKPFLWIWPTGLFQHGWGAWMQGWQITPAIMFWHHATMLMRPGRMNAWRWTRVLLGYAIAVVAIYVQVNTDLMFTVGKGDPLYLNTLKQGRLYPLFMGFLLLFTIMSLVNLVRSAKIAPARMPRRHLSILAAATLIAGLTGPTGFVNFLFDLSMPRVILTVLLGLTILLMGYGVARYSALVERRVLGRDLLYNGTAISLVALLYLVVGWVSVVTYGVPAAALAFIVVLAVFTHSLVDVGRQFLDFIFLRREARELRAQLRDLVVQVREPQALKENLSRTFHTLCDSVRASYGLILVFESDSASPLVSYRWSKGIVAIDSSLLMFDDVVQPELGELAPPLNDAALVMPLYVGGEQVGVLILGQPENALRYSQSDIETLLEWSDHISNVLQSIRNETEYLARISELTQLRQPPSDTGLELIPVQVVEGALRHLTDTITLGGSPLAEKMLLNGGSQIERGKQLQQLLIDSIESLKPAEKRPPEPLPRVWYNHAVLYDAYVECVPNREIMARLYISEGTFNRTRRNAIRGLARMLGERIK